MPPAASSVDPTGRGRYSDPTWRKPENSEAAKFPGATDVIRIDGLRVEYPDGFGLARGSNTTPVVVLRFEADSAAALERIKGEFRRVLHEAQPGLALPF